MIKKMYTKAMMGKMFTAHIWDVNLKKNSGSVVLFNFKIIESVG